MFKGKPFPERIQIMLPPPPKEEDQLREAKEAKRAKSHDKPEYVNLLKIQEETSMVSAQSLTQADTATEKPVSAQEKEEPSAVPAVTQETLDHVQGTESVTGGELLATPDNAPHSAIASASSILIHTPTAPSGISVGTTKPNSDPSTLEVAPRSAANLESKASQSQAAPEEKAGIQESASESNLSTSLTKPDLHHPSKEPSQTSHGNEAPQRGMLAEKISEVSDKESSVLDQSDVSPESQAIQMTSVDKPADNLPATELKVTAQANRVSEVSAEKAPTQESAQRLALGEPESAAQKTAPLLPPLFSAQQEQILTGNVVSAHSSTNHGSSHDLAAQSNQVTLEKIEEKRLPPSTESAPTSAAPATEEALKNLCPVPAVTSQVVKTNSASEKVPSTFLSPRRIAITGNPNCGKSTLFNSLTGLRQKVGNYPGVTVEKKEGTFFGSHGEQMQLLDLPGCYSLQSRSPDEEIARDVLLGRQADTPRPDAIVAVLDAANLERNLYLLSQLLELELPVFLALNMVDLAENKGLSIDPRLLGEQLGIPVIPLVASKGVGVIALKQALSQGTLPLPKTRATLPEALEREAKTIAKLLPENGAQFAEAALLLGMSEEQLAANQRLTAEQKEAIHSSRERLESAGLDPLSAAVDARYAWISTIIATAVRGDGRTGLTTSDKLDAVLTHRVWGWLAFLAAMSLMFFSIFTIAKLPADWISAGQSLLGGWLEEMMAEGDFRSLIVDGILAGVAGVLVFLPQILILTFFLGLLEDSGYMARAAFLMDRLMSRVGLHGKSFIPMLSSFACAIPGIMATRTIENRKDRLVTILVAPLMSCSARLPVYTLMIAVLIPEISVFKQAGIMLCMYLLGIVTAFVMAGVFKKTLLKSETPTLLMEMPPYRLPSMRSILTRMQERAAIFLKRAGTVILALSVLLWALMTYPKTGADTTGSERLGHSMAGQLGKAIEPVIAPLGFDWKIGIGLIGSLAAREVFVSTMSIVYSVENNGSESPIIPLSEVMRKEKRSDGTLVYTPLTGTALMVFYVLAMQCLSTLAVVRRETNSWGWPLFLFGYMTVLAYAGSWLVLHVGHMLGWR